MKKTFLCAKDAKKYNFALDALLLDHHIAPAIPLGQPLAAVGQAEQNFPPLANRSVPGFDPIFHVVVSCDLETLSSRGGGVVACRQAAWFSLVERQGCRLKLNGENRRRTGALLPVDDYRCEVGHSITCNSVPLRLYPEMELPLSLQK